MFICILLSLPPYPINKGLGNYKIYLKYLKKLTINILEMNSFLNGKQIFSKRRSAYTPFNTSITRYTPIETEPC